MTKIVTESYAIEQLKEYNQWICWGNNTVDSAGKMNKQPFPYGCTQTTDPTNPDLWASYDDCVVWREKRNLRGLGFAFTTDTGIMGIDFDNCVVNNVIDPEVMKIVTHLDSYTEFSPSGNGIHVLIYGSKPKDFTTSKVKLNNGLMMEVYDGKRYFTVTGNHVSGTPDKIHEAHSELADVIEKYRNTDKARSMVQAVNRDVALITTEYHPTWLERFMENKVASAVNKISNAVDGNRHDTRRAEARAVGGYYQSCVSHGYSSMSEQTIIDRLYDANVPIRANAVKEYRTIEWGFECGLKSPIDLPQMKEKEKPLTTTKSRPTPRKEVEYVTAPEVTEEVEVDQEPASPIIMELVEKIGDFDFATQMTHTGVARLFNRVYDENVYYFEKANIWYVWTDNHWYEYQARKGEHPIVLTSLVSNLGDALQYKYSGDEKVLKLILKLHDANFSHNVVGMIKSECKSMSPDEFNKHPDLFPVLNGIVHLPTKTLLPHDKKYRLTLKRDLTFDPNAKHPHLDRYLATTFKGQPAKQEYMQCVVGLSLSAYITSQREIFYLVGSGGNGKSIFKELVLFALLGDEYYVSTPTATLTAQRNDVSDLQPAIQRLRYKRVSFSNEFKEDAQFNGSTLKELSSGDRQGGRTLHKEAIEFNPVAKIFFDGNSLPNIKSMDEAFLGRLKVIEFNQDLKNSPEKIETQQFKDNFAGELSGLLNWAIEGFLKVQANGMKLPYCQDVELSTLTLRKSQDNVALFISEYLDVDLTNGKSGEGENGYYIQKDFLFALWNLYCANNNEKGASNFNSNKLSRLIKEKGFIRGKSGDTYYLRLQIKSIKLLELETEYNQTVLKNTVWSHTSKINALVTSNHWTKVVAVKEAVMQKEVDKMESDNNDTEPTPPTSGFKPLKQPAKVIAPEVVQSSLSINPSTIIDASSLQGKMLALIQVNPQGMYSSDIADLVGYSGKTERIMDDLFGLMDKGIVEYANHLWLLKK